MRTSTRIPGVANPATPTTSSTLTAQALMPWRNGGCQSAAGAHGGQAAVENRLALIDVRQDAATNSIFGLEDGALGRRAGDLNRGQIGGGKNSSELNIRIGRNHARGQHRLCRHHAVANCAVDQEGACAGNDESEEKDCKNSSVHLEACSNRLTASSVFLYFDGNWQAFGKRAS